MDNIKNRHMLFYLMKREDSGSGKCGLPSPGSGLFKSFLQRSALGHAGHLMVTGKREHNGRAQEKTLRAQEQLNSKPFPVGITPA